MFRINFGYYKRGENFECIGQPIYGSVSGNTLELVNKAYWDVYMNHNCMKYTEMFFKDVEEVER